ncbi:hypothetical protein PFDSM3638_07515 [Pyrococcus furiosus DSM 3638]|uniref:UPF0252 protein PF1496 n=3 Tax=Pyrococcus furiosus TaxID=2261 RepID=Y1496_PYRFU|nr:transglutaminase-like domain-containing protein [Pyrococcus furiosus]Q8U0T6.1 RecName: Full=UPF0252 protein PF1496 [Pyrococcus furiosus DSM 3638]AAL81620.1 hypothetical protein PF1496 [Pyrococcus furiosus DSM 3638]AFN04279.1 hypothetical protein PFC_06715 [Pyrococcus furiosus COM1]QEK79123.1 hypothetical protein PFDSM3638_07515 [Pyrococcus furiosus DSM 3638]
MKELDQILEKCAEEIDPLSHEIAERIRKLKNLPKDEMFLEYLRIIDFTSTTKIPWRKKNYILIILWKYGEKIERLLYSRLEHFGRANVPKRYFRLVDGKILSMLFLVFILFPAFTSHIWSFRLGYEEIQVGKEITFNENLCEYRTAWLYDFKASMVCTIKYGYGKVNIRLNSTNPMEAGVEVQRFISQIPYDYARLESGFSYIQTPRETIGRRIGVCSDFAILTAQVLLDNNVSPVYIIHTLFKGDITGGHATAALFINGTLWIFDWGSAPVTFSEYLDTIDRLWEVREVRVYRLTESSIVLDRVYKGEPESDAWRYVYTLTMLIGIFIIKRREWLWI